MKRPWILALLCVSGSVQAQDWIQFKQVVAATAQPGHRFGCALSLHQDRLLVGAEGDSTGRAYVFDRHTGGVEQWGAFQTIDIPPAFSNDRGFGRFTQLDEDGAFIASNEHVFRFAFDPIAELYVFDRVIHNGGGDLAKSDSYFIVGQCAGGFGTYDSAFKIYAQNAGGADAWGFQQLLLGDQFTPYLDITEPSSHCSMALNDAHFTYGSPITDQWYDQGPYGCAQGQVRRHERDTSSGLWSNTWSTMQNYGIGPRPYGKAVAQQGDTLYASFDPGCWYSAGGGIASDAPDLGWFHVAGLSPTFMLPSPPYLFAVEQEQDATYDNLYIFKQLGNYLLPHQVLGDAIFRGLDVDANLCAVGVEVAGESSVLLLGTATYLSVPEGSPMTSILITPNPAETEVMVYWPEAAKASELAIEMRDLSGRVVSVAPVLTAPVILPREGLPSGIYLLRLVGADGETFGTGKVAWR
ncbi:MAG: T9SS type A sorting domain-containing protein [Flavobacteriales bacterium]|nr:T9SS type A sorting domain-containing protein [Flavobacteriales bacterium]